MKTWGSNHEKQKNLHFYFGPCSTRGACFCRNEKNKFVL